MSVRRDRDGKLLADIEIVGGRSGGTALYLEGVRITGRSTKYGVGTILDSVTVNLDELRKLVDEIDKKVPKPS